MPNTTQLPADGETIVVHAPGQKRSYRWVVLGRDSLLPDEAVIAGRPSRQSPGDFISVGRIMAEWIVR